MRTGTMSLFDLATERHCRSIRYRADDHYPDLRNRAVGRPPCLFAIRAADVLTTFAATSPTRRPASSQTFLQHIKVGPRSTISICSSRRQAHRTARSAAGSATRRDAPSSASRNQHAPIDLMHEPEQRHQVAGCEASPISFASGECGKQLATLVVSDRCGGVDRSMPPFAQARASAEEALGAQSTDPLVRWPRQPRLRWRRTASPSRPVFADTQCNRTAPVASQGR